MKKRTYTVIIKSSEDEDGLSASTSRTNTSLTGALLGAMAAHGDNMSGGPLIQLMEMLIDSGEWFEELDVPAECVDSYEKAWSAAKRFHELWKLKCANNI